MKNSNRKDIVQQENLSIYAYLTTLVITLAGIKNLEEVLL